MCLHYDEYGGVFAKSAADLLRAKNPATLRMGRWLFWLLLRKARGCRRGGGRTKSFVYGSI
jgi:hypothetical protein